jgi:hypothetical protein
MRDDWQRRIAIHESGHGFMAHALGLALDRVQLDPPRFDLVDKLGADRRLDHARILAAGCAAEELLFGNAIGGGSDDPKIGRLLRGDDEDALRWEVKLFLAGNIPPVRRIADALLRHGALSGDEVEVLVRGAKTFPRPERTSVAARPVFI